LLDCDNYIAEMLDCWIAGFEEEMLAGEVDCEIAEMRDVSERFRTTDSTETN